jgi:hypothetical protein
MNEWMQKDSNWEISIGAFLQKLSWTKKLLNECFKETIESLPE